MGAAIGVLEGSQALEVPRSRFAPVKNLADLLVVRSLVYALDDQARLQPVISRLPQVTLGKSIATLEDLDRSFPVPLDLRECRSLIVEAELTCPYGLAVVGDCRLQGGPAVLAGGLRLSGTVELT